MKRMLRTPRELHGVMKDAIAYIEAHREDRPDSKAVAEAIGMSPSRFDHAFKEWVGITPKRFLGYLTSKRAKTHVLRAQNALNAAYGTGLSGPGRLHDLLVTYEAVSPGELKSGNIEFFYGTHPSPFGSVLVVASKRGIHRLSFLDSRGERDALDEIRNDWPKAEIRRNDMRTASYAKAIFGKSGKRPPIRLVVKGTNFQIKVWEALLSIPPGETRTYAQIAKTIGSPRSARAVGSACGKNAIAYLIPCHRVLASRGIVGGYRWGAARKAALLAWENAREQA